MKKQQHPSNRVKLLITTLFLMAFNTPFFAQNCNDLSISTCVEGFQEAVAQRIETVGDLDGENGFEIEGIHPDGRLGYYVSSIGDVNNDGFDDISVCAPYATPELTSEVGEIYIIFGNDTINTASYNIDNLNGENGFKVRGINIEDRLGYGGANAAGDINNDGIDDFIISTPYSDPDPDSLNTGSAFVIFGSEAPYAPVISVDMLDGTNGFTLNGTNYWDNFGTTGGYAGDMNGDNIDDFYVTADDTDFNGLSSGTVYVIYGKNQFPDTLDVDTLYLQHGFLINGKAAEDNVGISAGSLPDLNGDGINDLAIGAFHANNDTGAGYVIFGKNTNFTDTINTTDLDGTNGFELLGNNIGSYVGITSGDAGDLNNDGLNDMFISGHSVNSNGLYRSGETYIIYGSTQPYPAVLQLSALNGTRGFKIKGGDYFGFSGFSVMGLGDVNGDARDDLLIGSVFAGSNNLDQNGAAYIIFGRNEDFPPSIALNSLATAEGYSIKGNESHARLGFNVGSGGDFNGDGVRDFILGADYGTAMTPNAPGKAYLIYGTKESTYGCNAITSTACIGDTITLNVNTTLLGSWSFSGGGYLTMTSGNTTRYVPSTTDAGIVIFSWLANNNFSCYDTQVITYDICEDADQLTSFTHTKGSLSATLKWTIDFESKTDYFTIEQKNLLGEFSPLINISGQGISPNTNQYQYTVQNLQKNVLYQFRLKHYLNDGSFTYSDIETVILRNKTRGGLTAFPNPTIGIFTIGGNLIGGDNNGDVLDVTITNAMGQIVLQDEFDTNLNDQKTLDIQHLSDGVYFYHISDPSGKFSEQGKVVKAAQ